MGIRKEQAENTRFEICKSVEKLLEEKKTKEITVKDICNKAKVSVGTFYHYYTSKEEALYDISTPIDIYFEETVFPLLEGKSQKEKLITFFTYQAEYSINHLYPSSSSKTELLFFKNFFNADRYFQKLLLNILNDGNEFNDYIEIMTLNGLVNHLLFLSRGIIITWTLESDLFNLKERLLYEINLFFNLPKLLSEKK